MGNFKSKKKLSVLCIGLDDSGKSTLINYLKPAKQKKVELNATIGYSVEKVKFGAINFVVYDMSGQGKYRDMWEHYYADADGIIFVIDSANEVRMCVVKDELDTLLSNKDIAKKEIPILFFANKSDLPKALSPSEISKALELDNIIKKEWRIVASNAITGDGTEEGMEWLSDQIQEKDEW